MGWNTFRERLMKAALGYKARLERMEDTRLARKVYLWNECSSKWGKWCLKMVCRSGMGVRWMHERINERIIMSEWKMVNGNREGLEWNVKKWKTEIDKMEKHMDLRKWKY